MNKYPMDHVVSRHSSTTNLILEKFDLATEATFIHDGNMDEAKINSGDTVYGILPLHLIAKLNKQGVKVIVVQLPHLSAEQRGRELSPAELIEAGATFSEAKVELTPLD